MHVAQLPASHEDGGRRPPRRAVSSRVSPAWYCDGVLLAFEPDHHRLGSPATRGTGSIRAMFPGRRARGDDNHTLGLASLDSRVSSGGRLHVVVDRRLPTRSRWRRSPARSAPRSAGVDLAVRARRTRPSPRSGSAWLEHLVVFFRDQTLGPGGVPRLRPPHRRAGRVPVRARASTDFPEIIAVTKLPHETVNFGGHLAQRHRVPRATADGDDADRARSPAVRRRHDVREHVRRVRSALARDAAPARRPACGEQLGPRRRVEDERRPHSRQRRRTATRSTSPSIPSCARIPRRGARRSTSTSRTRSASPT